MKYPVVAGVVTVFLAAIALSGAPGAAVAAENVTGCQVIESPGEYQLNASISNGQADPCIDIVASNVVFDGQGHELDGIDKNGRAIKAQSGTTNLTITNVTARNWTTGIELENSSRNEITASTLVSNADYGIYAYGQFLDGVYVNGADHNRIENVEATGNSYGVILEGSQNSTVTGILAANNTDGGITHWFADGNLIADNRVINNSFEGGIGVIGADNTIRDNTVLGNQPAGIVLWNYSYNDWRISGNLVANNTVGNTVGNGIILTGDDGSPVSDNVVRDNAAFNNSASGISLGQWKESLPQQLEEEEGDQVIEDPIIFELPPDSAHNNIVRNNDVWNNSFGGIRVRGSDNNTIAGNTANDTYVGIFIEDASADNTVVGNELTHSQAGLFSGYNATANQFRENHASDNAAGVYLHSSSQNTFEETVLRGGNDEWAIIADSGSVNDFVHVGFPGFSGITPSFTNYDTNVSATEPPGSPPGDYDFIGLDPAFETSPNAVDAYLNLTIDYYDWAVANFREETLALWKQYTEDGWQTLEDVLSHHVLEPGTNTLTANVTEFGTLAPVAEAAYTDFRVRDVTPDDPVTAGDPLPVAVTVENTGTVAGTETIKLAVDRNQDGTFLTAAQTSLSLEPGETATRTFSLSTARGDFPELTVRGSTPHDSATATATIERAPAAHFTVDILNTTSPVKPTENATVTAEIENVGDGAGTQTVEFGIAETEAAESVSLDPGATASLTFEWDPSESGPGDYQATVSSHDESASTTITVIQLPRPEFVDGRVPDDTPSLIELSFDMDVVLNETVSDTTGLDVTVDDQPASIQSVTTSGSDLVLELGTPVEAEQTVAVSYTDGSGNLESLEGAESLPFEDEIVDNLVEAEPGIVANVTAETPDATVVVDEVSVGTETLLKANRSVVPPDADVVYEWTVNGESFTTTVPILPRTFDRPGTVRANLTITANGQTSYSNTTFEVVDRTPPVARLSAEDTIGVGGDPSLDGSGSSDNVDIVSYEWDFGDGTTREGASLVDPDHAYDEPGDYEVTLTVTDSSGNTARNSTTVVVEQSESASLIDLRWLWFVLLLLVLIIIGMYYHTRKERDD